IRFSVPTSIACRLSSACTLPCFFLSTPLAPTYHYPLSLHDALPICSSPPGTKGRSSPRGRNGSGPAGTAGTRSRESSRRSHTPRSEEHTSELQSRFDLVCRLLLEKKKEKQNITLNDKISHTTHISK